MVFQYRIWLIWCVATCMILCISCLDFCCAVQRSTKKKKKVKQEITSISERKDLHGYPGVLKISLIWVRLWGLKSDKYWPFFENVIMISSEKCQIFISIIVVSKYLQNWKCHGNIAINWENHDIFWIYGKNKITKKMFLIFYWVYIYIFCTLFI